MRVALLTVSDSAAAGHSSDLSGPLLHKKVAEAGWTVVRADIVADDLEAITSWLRQAVDERKVDLVLTSGGIGLGPRDVTPEATQGVLEREAPGISEAIRVTGMAKTPRAMLSRGLAGTRGQTLIINLSGNPRAVTEQWECIAPVIEYAVDTVQGLGHHPAADAERRRAQSKPLPREISQPKREVSQPKREFSLQGTLLGAPGAKPSDEE